MQSERAETDGERRSLLNGHRETEPFDSERQAWAANGAVRDTDATKLKHDPIGLGRAICIMLSLWGLIFCAATNMSIMTTLQSTIAEDLNAYEDANWFTSVYLITLSSFAPLAAKLASVFSPRLCISGASLLFALGAVITSLASSVAVLLLGRGVSGLGAAGCMMTVFSFVVDLASEKRRGLLIGMVNTGFTSGVALGAVIAGALLPSAGWRPIFAFQVPISVLAGIGIFLSAPRNANKRHVLNQSKTPGKKLAHLDYLGATALISGLVLLLTGLATAKILWIPIILSPLAFACFVYIELYIAKDPVIPISILRSRGVLLSALAQLGMMIARWAILFYVPVYAIAVRDLSASKAGAFLVPTNFGMATGSLLIGWLHIKRSGSFYSSMLSSYLIFACTLLALSQLSNPTISVAVYTAAILISGIAAGGVVTYVPVHMLHLTLPEDHALALSLLTTARGFAGSFASAIGGGLFLRSLSAYLHAGFQHAGLTNEQALIRRLLGSPATVHRLTGQERIIAMTAYAQSLHMIFLVAAGLAFLMTLVQAAAGKEAPKGLQKTERGILPSGDLQSADDTRSESI